MSSLNSNNTIDGSADANVHQCHTRSQKPESPNRPACQDNALFEQGLSAERMELELMRGALEYAGGASVRGEIGFQPKVHVPHLHARSVSTVGNTEEGDSLFKLETSDECLSSSSKVRSNVHRTPLSALPTHSNIDAKTILRSTKEPTPHTNPTLDAK